MEGISGKLTSLLGLLRKSYGRAYTISWRSAPIRLSFHTTTVTYEVVIAILNARIVIIVAVVVVPFFVIIIIWYFLLSSSSAPS